MSMQPSQELSERTRYFRWFFSVTVSMTRVGVQLNGVRNKFVWQRKRALPTEGSGQGELGLAQKNEHPESWVLF